MDSIPDSNAEELHLDEYVMCKYAENNGKTNLLYAILISFLYITVVSLAIRQRNNQDKQAKIPFQMSRIK